MAYTEVHGGQHRQSLPYDANRETIIAGTLGWLASEVTSIDIRRTPKATIARMVEFIATATRRAAS
jgi:very-short-patch-repair endonuclease